MNEKTKALKAAFPYTIPIFAGFVFLGIAYGIYMNTSGFNAAYPIVMSATIFAGSMEFVAVNLLLGAFDPIRAFAITLMVNARHLFYGISMLDKFKVQFNTKGLEFVMTALFVVIFLEQWMKEKKHHSALKKPLEKVGICE